MPFKFGNAGAKTQDYSYNYELVQNHSHDGTHGSDVKSNWRDSSVILKWGSVEKTSTTNILPVVWPVIFYNFLKLLQFRFVETEFKFKKTNTLVVQISLSKKILADFVVFIQHLQHLTLVCANTILITFSAKKMWIKKWWHSKQNVLHLHTKRRS